MAEVFANTPSGTVASPGGTTAPSPGTTETWTVQVSAAFPVASGSNYFHVAEPGVPGEVIKVTSAPGGTGSQTWTVTRGDEGTTPIAHTPGFTVTDVVTANWLNNRSVPPNPLAPAGAIAETFPRQSSNTPSAAAKTSGTLYVSAIAIPNLAPIGHITYPSASGGAAVSPTHWWFALLDSSLNLLAVTADQTTTAWGGNVTMTLAIATIASGASSTYTTSYGGLYYVGLMMAATTPVTTVRGSGNIQQGVHGVAPILGGPSDTAQTTPPAFPHTATALTSAAALAQDYAYVS